MLLLLRLEVMGHMEVWSATHPSSSRHKIYRGILQCPMRFAYDVDSVMKLSRKKLWLVPTTNRFLPSHDRFYLVAKKSVQFSPDPRLAALHRLFRWALASHWCWTFWWHTRFDDLGGMSWSGCELSRWIFCYDEQMMTLSDEVRTLNQLNTWNGLKRGGVSQSGPI